jgi:hypothetical protein
LPGRSTSDRIQRRTAHLERQDVGNYDKYAREIGREKLKEVVVEHIDTVGARPSAKLEGEATARKTRTRRVERAPCVSGQAPLA